MNSKNSKILTIVIPVFKVEKYIRQCLDSIVLPKDEMDQLEVIVVNDGTPDNSAIIAHEYADKYPNSIRVIDKENGGHGSAWNVGLKMATGKYIRFLDSDDWLSNLSVFINKLSSIETDMVFTHINHYFEQTDSIYSKKINNIDYNSVYDTSTFSYKETGHKYGMFNFWYCTYKTKMLQNEQPLFVERVYYDDAIFFIAPYLIGHSMIFLDLTLYNYRLGRPGQTVDINVKLAHADDYLKVSESLINFANSHTKISQNQKEQRNAVLNSYMKQKSLYFSFLPYNEYKDKMSRLLSLMEKAPYLKKSPKLYIYKYTPSIISWCGFMLFNKIVLPILNK